jgi:signal transduction histidine kinase
VSEFLDFARPRPPERSPTPARALCERAVQLVSTQAKKANTEVALDFPTRDPILNVDAAKIEQVLLNLLANGIEAIRPPHKGHVTLRMRRQPRGVFFEVEDDGPGLSTPQAPIFDAFFSTKPKGTGLGLSISHRIASDHGGTLTMERRSERTVFRMTLPLDAEGA